MPISTNDLKLRPLDLPDVSSIQAIKMIESLEGSPLLLRSTTSKGAQAFGFETAIEAVNLWGLSFRSFVLISMANPPVE